MNKKTIITISAVAGLIIIGLVVFVLLKPSAGETTGGGILSFFFPSSPEGPTPIGTVTPIINPVEPTQPTTQNLGVLAQLTEEAVVGPILNKKTGKIQYFEKGTGHLFEMEINGSGKNQRTITTIPKIFEVFWSKDADRAILRYLNGNNNGNGPETTRTFLASFSATSTSGILLPSGTFSVAASPEEDKIFYLLGEDSASGVTASFENKSQKEIFSSSFTEFLANWPQKNIITLLTKPTSLTGGYLYSLNPQTGSFVKILNNIKGLTTLYPPAGDKLIYAESANKSFSAKVYDLKTGQTIDLSPNTLPEKCVFSAKDENIIYCGVPKAIPQVNYPDDWYKGLISFSDGLWKIDLKNGATKMLLNESELDMINPFLSPEENSVFFQNKKDGNLWSFQITPETGY